MQMLPRINRVERKANNQTLLARNIPDTANITLTPINPYLINNKSWRALLAHSAAK